MSADPQDHPSGSNRRGTIWRATRYRKNPQRSWTHPNPESAARIIPDRDAEPVASLGEARESIAAITTEIAPCSGTDLVSRDVTTEVVLGAVGVERDLRPVQDHQQLSLGPHPDCRATPGRAKSLVACGPPP